MTMIKVFPEDLKYPNKKEFSQAKKIFPRIPLFGFKSSNLIKDTLQGTEIDSKYLKQVELYNWDKVLEYRLSNLTRSFIFLESNYSRGIYAEHEERIEKDKLVNEYMFSYYSEIFYYHIITVRDTVLQIINCFYECKIEERNVNIRHLISKTDTLSKEVLELLQKAKSNDSETAEIRNIFSHRFPKNIGDYRLIEKNEKENHLMSVKKDDKTFIVKGKEFQPKYLRNKINTSLEFILEFVKGIKSETEKASR